MTKLDELIAAATNRYGSKFSPLTCRAIGMFWACAELDQIRLKTFFQFCQRNGLSNAEVCRAIGELHSLEYAFTDWCDNANAYFVTFMNLDAPNRSGADILTAFEDIRKELFAA